MSTDPEVARGSSKKARLLLDAASDFCMRERPREEDIKVFREFFTQLIGTCRGTDRRALSATIATNPYVPRSIAFYLALDDVEVAAPMLLLSPVIKEADIIALARKLSHAHLAVLCRRNDLSPASVVSLLAHGGRRTAELLARNALAPKNAAPRLDESPAERENQAETVQTAAAPRREAVEKRIDDGRRDQRLPGDARESNAERPATATNDRSSELLALAARGGRLGRDASTATGATRTQPPGPIESDEKKLAQSLLDAARNGGQLAVADLMAKQARCSIEIVANLLSQDSIEPFCVLMKGLGVDSLPAAQLILLLRPETGRSRENLAKATGFYRRLEEKECRHFVESLGGRAVNANKTKGNMQDRPAPSLADAVSARRNEIAAREPMRPTARPAGDGAGDLRPAATFSGG